MCWQCRDRVHGLTVADRLVRDLSGHPVSGLFDEKSTPHEAKRAVFGHCGVDFLVCGNFFEVEWNKLNFVFVVPSD
ncbi:hypothetical protein FRC0493_02051 [Corynebacterium diphtheriae]|nr:hypothetical protein FRC0493_02051 [Corynebacterium diphtheriae]